MGAVLTPRRRVVRTSGTAAPRTCRRANPRSRQPGTGNRARRRQDDVRARCSARRRGHCPTSEEAQEPRRGGSAGNQRAVFPSGRAEMPVLRSLRWLQPSAHVLRGATAPQGAGPARGAVGRRGSRTGGGHAPVDRNAVAIPPQGAARRALRDRAGTGLWSDSASGFPAESPTSPNASCSPTPSVSS